MPAQQESNGSTTRDRILEVAARLFVERGFDATTVRDIAAVVEISNPSLYHHFSSKSAILEELLAEPLRRSHTAAQEASLLSGRAKVQRVITGLLEALEVHSGVAVTALQRPIQGLDVARPIVSESRPMAYDLLKSLVSGENADLKVRMLIGAVESVVLEIVLTAQDGADFVETLRGRRQSIVDLAMRLLD